MFKDKIEKTLSKAAKKSKTLQFAMNLPSIGERYSYSNTTANQRFHSASVGKLMTAVLIFIAIEQEKLTINTNIKDVLGASMLENLFVFENKDYKEEITVKDLLGHMSGVNDYFESKAFDGSLFTDDVIKNPDTMWKPIDLIDYTRKNQKAVAKPGQKFFYSDTGYILLGLVIEKAFGIPFSKALETYIFKPSLMNETELCFYNDSFEPKLLAPLYINGTDVHLFKSLSCDFSGGGLSTTADDLLKFLDSLQNNRYIGKNSLELMASFNNRYRQGLYYGNGMMQARFEEFFFMLKGMPRLRGHIGVTGVHAWFDPETKDTFVINMGNTKDMVKSFKLLITILQLIQKERKL